MKNLLHRCFPILFFVLVTALAFWKVLFHREFSLLAGTDISAAYFPWFDIAASWLKKGSFLLWNPYVYAGKPFMGEPQAGLYYPLNWLFMLAPARSGGMSLASMQALIIMDYFLAGLFFFFFARSLGQTSRGAAVSGIAWSYGGFVAQLYGYINVLSGFVWLPLAFLFFRRGLTQSVWKPRVRHFLISGVFLAASFLPGHYVPVVHIGFFLFLYAIYMLVSGWSKNYRPQLTGAACGLGITALTGALLTAFQWLPSLDWARHAYRWIGDVPPLKWGDAVPYSAIQHSSHVNPQDALSLLFPYMSTGLNLYLGLAVLFLAFIGVIFVRRRDIHFFIFAAFLYFFLSFGPLSAVHGWFFTFIPGVHLAREVFYYLVPFQACMALLAGEGLDYLVESYSATPSETLQKFIRRTGWTLAFIILMSGALVVVLFLQQHLPLAHIHVRGLCMLASYAILIGILLYFLHTKRISPKLFSILMIAIVAVDLSSHISLDIRAKANTGDPETTFTGEYWKKSSVAEALIAKRKQEYFRIEDREHVFPQNFGNAWKLDETMGYSATALVDFFSLRDTNWDPCSNAVSLLNARYFLSRTPIPELEKAFGENSPAYVNPRAVPRAFIAERYLSFTDRQKMLEWIASPLMAPAETVLLLSSDRNKLPDSFWNEAANEDEGFVVRQIAAKTAAQKNAETSLAQKDKSQAFQLPWGWSAGDEATIYFTPPSPKGDAFLVLNYYPISKTPSRLALHLSNRIGERAIHVELAGLSANEMAPEKPRQRAVNLGNLDYAEYKLILIKDELCSARIDSFRFTKRSSPPDDHARNSAIILSHKPNQIQLSVHVDRPSFVVVSEVFYSGWEAFVDGKPSPMFAGDYVLRAVPVLPGGHAIEMRYRPRILFGGLAASLVSALFIGFIIRRLKTAQT